MRFLALLTKAQHQELGALWKDETRWKKKDLKLCNHSSESDISDISVRIKHSGNKQKSKKCHKMKSKDTSGTPPRSEEKKATL
jgi:hypothetical protein